ncbi:hypothetical protein HDC91_003942 [Mucilaginibacter sp. AK015]|nr:hypothetical protein [Mucilaginibacter sp. AK015]
MEVFSYKSGLLVRLFGKLSSKRRSKVIASSHTTDVYRLNPEVFLKKTEKIKVFSGFFSSLTMNTATIHIRFRPSK